MDVEGNLSVCDAGNGCVWMFSKWGEPLFRIRSCTGGGTTTNLTYGGPNNKTLFITESDTGMTLQASFFDGGAGPAAPSLLIIGWPNHQLSKAVNH